MLYTRLFICVLSVLPMQLNKQLNGTMYDLYHPDKKLFLPAELHEVSGLTALDANTVACIQDEQGILFIYDLVQEKITNKFTFYIDGDYEGITRIQNALYILRSDGTLFELNNYTSKDATVRKYDTGIPSGNNEGLCYDAEHNRLLIAAKGKIGKGPEYKNSRVIYAFDLLAKQFSTEPVYDFDLGKMKEFIRSNYPDFPVKKAKKKSKEDEPDLKFKTSAICIHPVTKKLYLLSASDHCLFIFNKKGDPENIIRLDPELFNKAEGITFLSDGDMIISNEGQEKQPSLLLFEYKP